MSLFRSRFNKASSAIMHSNAFAEVTDKTSPSFGSTSAETFSQRRQVDSNRQHVDSFRGALIHNDYRMQRLQDSSRGSQDSVSSRRSVVQTTRPSQPVPPRPTGTFHEPPSRGFNPFR